MILLNSKISNYIINPKAKNSYEIDYFYAFLNLAKKIQQSHFIENLLICQKRIKKAMHN